MPRKKDPNRKPLPPGRPALYPWDTWLDGEEHTLRAKRDFFCTRQSMRTALYKKASQRGMKVVISLRPEAVVIKAQGAKPDPQRTRYDWDKLLNGGIHMLEVDNPTSFANYARAVAGERDKAVSIRTINTTVIIKAEDKES